jgi:hypothetical protein
VFTAFTCFGLAAVSAWFASERWTFSRHRGKKWLSDVLIEFLDAFFGLPGMGLIKKCYHWLRRHVRAARASIKRTSSGLPMHNGDVELNDDIEGGSLPSLANPSEPHRMSDAISRTASEPSSPISQVSSLETAMPNTPVTLTKGKQLWKNAFKSVKMHSAMSSLMKLGPPSPARQRTTSSAAAGERKKTNGEEPVKAVLRSRVAALVPKLKILDTTQDLAAHQALVRHLQFSPDGKYLATSRSVIWMSVLGNNG